MFNIGDKVQITKVAGPQFQHVIGSHAVIEPHPEGEMEKFLVALWDAANPDLPLITYRFLDGPLAGMLLNGTKEEMVLVEAAAQVAA